MKFAKSVFSQVFVFPGRSLSRGVSFQGISVQGGLCRGLCAGGSLSRGISFRGVSAHGNLCPGGFCPRGSLSRRGLCPRDPPPPHGKERVVHILLECILVLASFVVYGTSSVRSVTKLLYC